MQYWCDTARAAMEGTAVQLRTRTVTDYLAPMRGRRVFQFEVGDLSVPFAVWVTEVRNACILGLDY